MSIKSLQAHQNVAKQNYGLWDYKCLSLHLTTKQHLFNLFIYFTLANVNDLTNLREGIYVYPIRWSKLKRDIAICQLLLTNPGIDFELVRKSAIIPYQTVL